MQVQNDGQYPEPITRRECRQILYESIKRIRQYDDMLVEAGVLIPWRPWWVFWGRRHRETVQLNGPDGFSIQRHTDGSIFIYSPRQELHSLVVQAWIPIDQIKFDILSGRESEWAHALSTLERIEMTMRSHLVRRPTP